MKTRGWKMADGGWRTRSVLECGGPPPLFPGVAGSHRAQSARGRAHSKTWRPAGHEPGTRDEGVAGYSRRRGVAAARWRTLLFCFILLPSAFSLPASAQNYTIDWHKIAGGGGTSTGGTYQVSGTIGQPDANAQSMTGGSYALTGGFWSLISVVQTPGSPNLTITHSGNSVIVSWPATGSYTLQQNANLAMTGGWTTSGYTITTANSTNSVTITPPTGNLFFRLAR